MVSISRVSRLVFLCGCAGIAAASLTMLGSEGWVTNGFPTSEERQADVWGGFVRPVAVNRPASEADWLTAQKALQPAVVPGSTWQGTTRPGTTQPSTTQIDLGPLDILDVRPLPREVNFSAETDAGAGGAKMLVTARDAATGRTVRLIIEADPVSSSPVSLSPLSSSTIRPGL